MLRAIETRYRGYRFRSRLEARWAVYMDHLGIKWEYEKEGFELQSGRYLPDFWIPEWEMWFEVKGNSKFSTRLTSDLVHYSGLSAAFVLPEFLTADYIPQHILVIVPDSDQTIAATLGICFCHNTAALVSSETPHDGWFPGAKFQIHKELSDATWGAINAARSARFEFGESGAR